VWKCRKPCGDEWCVNERDDVVSAQVKPLLAHAKRYLWHAEYINSRRNPLVIRQLRRRRASLSRIGNNSSDEVANSVVRCYWFATNRLTRWSASQLSATHDLRPHPLRPTTALPRPRRILPSPPCWMEPRPVRALTRLWFMSVDCCAASQLVCINVPPSERASERVRTRSVQESGALSHDVRLIGARPAGQRRPVYTAAAWWVAVRTWQRRIYTGQRGDDAGGKMR